MRNVIHNFKKTEQPMSYIKFTTDVSNLIGELKKSDQYKNRNDLFKIAELMTRDKWIQEKKYREFISYYLESYDTGGGYDFIKPFSDILINDKDLGLYKKLWRGAIKIVKDRFYSQFHNWLNFSLFDKIRYFKRLNGNRKNATLAIKLYLTGLKNFNDQNEYDFFKSELKLIQKYKRRKPTPTSDKRNIDQKLFWELIDESSKNVSLTYEFMDNLQTRLSKFAPKQIINFQRLLYLNISELNTWDLWALAYIVRKGCGDDEFDYFKAWFITKGSKIFSLRNDLRILSNDFEVAEDPQCEDLYYLAQDIYLFKTGDSFPNIRLPKTEILGKKWDEETLNREYKYLIDKYK